MSKNPTTREIAAACGCNQSTVSRALSNSSKIPEETRIKILKAAEKLGWRPNPLASAYMAHLRGTRPPHYQANLAFLIGSPVSGVISELPLHIQRHYRGAQDRAEQLGFRLDTFWAHEPGLNAKRLQRVLLSRNIPGLIISSLLWHGDWMNDFEWKHFACAALGFSLTAPELHRVSVRHLHGFNMILQKAQSLGYKHIAVMISKELDNLVDHAALCAAYYQKNAMADACRIDIYPFTIRSKTMNADMKSWLRKQRPQVVLGEDVVLTAICEMGWRIPQDVAYISQDRAPEYPDFGGFDQCHDKHGNLAVDLVVSQIIHNERGIPKIPTQVSVEGCWADGISVPPFQTILKLDRSAESQRPMAVR